MSLKRMRARVSAAITCGHMLRAAFHVWRITPGSERDKLVAVANAALALQERLARVPHCEHVGASLFELADEISDKT